MKIGLLIVALFLTFGATQKADIKLEVGSVLPAKYVPKKNLNLYMTHSSQFRPFIKREVAGINYVIAYEKKSREIMYIYRTIRGLGPPGASKSAATSRSIMSESRRTQAGRFARRKSGVDGSRS